MVSSPLAARTVRFGVFELDCQTGELRKQGVRLRLQGQPVEVLTRLLETPGELVTREELRNRLWAADTFVDFDQALNNSVQRIREALGDSAQSPRFIETIPKRGYRFVGSVSLPQAEPVPGSLPEKPRKSRTAYLTFAAVLVLAGIGMVLLVLRWQQNRRLPQIRAIAVLPLQNLSGDPGQEYFADGMTEELITTLAKLTDLKVISRTSSMRLKGAQVPIKEIGRTLDVDAIVEGSIARSPDTVRITVQLIDARSDRHLWAEEYEGAPGDILQLQKKVAQQIALQVSAKIVPQEKSRPAADRPVDFKAHDLYLRARFFASQGTAESLTKSVELYQQAVSLQPDYAAAYSGLAESYCALGSGWDDAPYPSFPRAREAALKALSLDNSIPGARRELAWVKHAYDWDTAGADAEFQVALKLHGYDAETHSLYASFLADIGRFGEALAQARLAEDLDPLSVRSSVSAERVLMRGRRFEEFLRQAERSRRLDPQSVLTTVHLCFVYEDLGRFEDAIHEIETHSVSADPPEKVRTYVKQLRTGLGQEGPKGYWRAALQTLSKDNADDHRNMAHLYFMLGDNKVGLRELELAVKQHDPGIRFDIKGSPWWDPVRTEPRFQQLLHEVGF